MTSVAKKGRLPITIDKSHIHTIGEKLYTRSIELIRELVNNAYDADATSVNVVLDYDDKRIVIEDNGSGMDEDGLCQYFTIGSAEKRKNPISPKFGRKRIGELGIGKFSTLGAASLFKVSTKRDNFAATVTFSKAEWSATEDDWGLPIIYSHLRDSEEDGTTIILEGVTQHFTEQEVIDRLRLSVPVGDKHFEVFVNGQRVTKQLAKGRRIPIDETTNYGRICGEIVISETPFKLSQAGIECRVKNVTINRSLFGHEGAGHGVNRIVGSVNADFLPFTSSRDNFIVDTAEYREFYSIMKERVADAMKFLKQEESVIDIQERTKALKEANKKVNEALKKCPDLCPKEEVLISPRAKAAKDLPEVVATKNYNFEKNEEGNNKESGEEKDPPEKIRSTIRGDHAPKHERIIKKLKNDFGIKIGLQNDGEDGFVSSFSKYDGTIYINPEHKLYVFFKSKGAESEIDYLIKLIISETVLLRQPADLRQGMDMQNQLLQAAYCA